MGLALGSGSARGWSHIGVLRALLEHGIRPAVVSGASTGSLVAAAYASDQLDKLEAWVRTLTKIDVWRLLDATLAGGGIIRGNRVMQAVARQLEDRPIEDLARKFGAVAVDLYTGEEVCIQQGSMLNAVRASSGLPGLLTPIRHDDRWLIDGGVLNPVPVSLCRALGADYVIAVNLSLPIGRRLQGSKAGDT
ncbi:MAG: patatin-like phospholipase family protein, partial [Gammaproteobacteria bacterium]|nr:patatin-like phospholipase family protein [Gammaproteobacteria bacterium]